MIFRPEAARVARWLDRPENAAFRAAFRAAYPAWRDRPVYLWPATPNAYTVVLVNVCDGRRTVDGNSGWFGESG